MHKILFIITVSLFSNISFGQKTNIENLINQIYRERVPFDFEYYNLVDSSFVATFDKNSLRLEELTAILQQYPDFPFDALIKASKTCSVIDWNEYSLINAKIYSEVSIPKFQSQNRLNRIVPYTINKKNLESLNRIKKFYEVIVPVKKHWSKKRINYEIQKTWINYSDSIKKENKTYFWFSTPIILDNYAILTLNQCGAGASYIFRKIDGNWKQILKFRRWII